MADGGSHIFRYEEFKSDIILVASDGDSTLFEGGPGLKCVHVVCGK